MRVVFCWSQISGYMAACWREFAKYDGIDVSILAYRSGQRGTNAKFNDDVMKGLDCTLLDADERGDSQFIIDKVKSLKPDVLVVPGWINPAYCKVVLDPEIRSSTSIIMGMDTPYQNTFRQNYGGWLKRGYFQCIDRVVVTGERSWQLARVLGFEEYKIRRGVYGVDTGRLAPAWESRSNNPDGWPKKFLYIGRFAKVKAIDLLAEAYQQYRDQVEDPWPLVCCGTGEMEDILTSLPGVDCRGFLQPDRIPDVMAECGAMVLPSKFDPWPLVIVESCAGGLPVLCTEACGSSVELIRPYYNGLAVTTGNTQAFRDGMVWMHNQYDSLEQMGARSREMAAGYSAEMWALRWYNYIHELRQA